MGNPTPAYQLTSAQGVLRPLHVAAMKIVDQADRETENTVLIPIVILTVVVVVVVHLSRVMMNQEMKPSPLSRHLWICTLRVVEKQVLAALKVPYILQLAQEICT